MQYKNKKEGNPSNNINNNLRVTIKPFEFIWLFCFISYISLRILFDYLFEFFITFININENKFFRNETSSKLLFYAI